MAEFWNGKFIGGFGGGSGSGSDSNNKGYFATQLALETSYPIGQDGWFAIVGSTDTIWTWDTATTSWKDTDTKGQVQSVNGQAGSVVLTQDNIADGLIYKQYSQTEKTKLSNIDTNAVNLTTLKTQTVTGNYIIPSTNLKFAGSEFINNSGTPEFHLKERVRELTQTQIDAILWGNGDVVYNITLGGFYKYNGTSWTAFIEDSITDGIIDRTASQNAISDALATKLDKNILTTKGDTYVATAANTVTRQGVGADNTMAIADSSQAAGWKNDFIKDANIDVTAINTTLIQQKNAPTLTNSPIAINDTQDVINGKLQAQVNAAGSSAGSTTATMVFEETMAVNTAVQINNSGGVIKASKTYSIGSAPQSIQSFSSQTIEVVTGVTNGTTSPVWLDDTRVLTIYNTGTQIKARAGTVAGNTITYNTIVNGPALSTEMISAFPMLLSGNNVTIQLLQTSTTGANNGAVAVLCPVTTPSFGAVAPLSPVISNGSPSICGCEVGVNKFLIVAGATGNLFYQMGTLSGTTITYSAQGSLGTVSNFNYSQASVTLIATSGNNATVLITQTPVSQTVSARVATLDLTTGVLSNFGTAVNLSTTANLSFRKVVQYNNGLCAMLLLDTTFGGFDYCIQLFNVSGNVITLNGASQRITTANTAAPTNGAVLTLKSHGSNKLSISGTLTGGNLGVGGSKRIIPLAISGPIVTVGTPGGIIANSVQSNIIQEDLAVSPNGLKYALGYITDTLFNPSISIGTLINGGDLDNRSQYFGIVKTAANAGSVGEIYTLGALANNLSGFTEGSSYYIDTNSLLTTVNTGYFAGKALSPSLFKVENNLGNISTSLTIQDNALTLTNAAIAQGENQSVINGKLQGQLNARAPLASPTFTGTVTVPTPVAATAAATKGYVDGLVGTKRYLYAALTTPYQLPNNTQAQDIFNFGQIFANGITVSNSAFTLPAGIYQISASLCVYASVSPATTSILVMATIVNAGNNVAISPNFSLSAATPPYTGWVQSIVPSATMIINFANTTTIKMRTTQILTSAGVPVISFGNPNNGGTVLTILQI